MSKQDGILLTAVQLRRFSSWDLITACELQPAPAKRSTIRKWLTQTVAKKHLLVVGSINDGERGRPSDLYEVQEAALVAARANVEMFQALAKAQFSTGAQHGFKPRPDFSDLNDRAGGLLREAVGELRHHVGAGFPVTGSDRIALFDRLRRVFTPNAGNDLGRLQVLRREIADEVSRIGDVIDSWEGIEHPVPEPLIHRYRAIKNVARDPRTFLLVASMQDISDRHAESDSRANIPRRCTMIPDLARVIGHDVTEEAARAIRNAPSSDGSDPTPLAQSRVQPSHRLVYAIDYEWSLVGEPSALEVERGGVSCDTAPAWTVCLGLLCAHADVGHLTTSDSERPQKHQSQVARAAISSATKRIGWHHVITSITRATLEGRLCQEVGTDGRGHLELATKLAFSLRDIISWELKDTRPSDVETLTLLGAMLQLLHQPAMRPLEALLRNACNRRFEDGFTVGDRAEFDHLLQPGLIDQLDRGVLLQQRYPDWYDDLTHMAPISFGNSSGPVPTGGYRGRGIVGAATWDVPEVPGDLLGMVRRVLAGPEKKFKRDTIVKH